MSEIVTEDKRGPGRPKRSEEVKAVRRRRGSMGADRDLKLHVPDDLKDPDFVYRWVNDKPGRVAQRTIPDSGARDRAPAPLQPPPRAELYPA